MKFILILFSIQFISNIAFAQDLIWEKTTEFTVHPILKLIDGENNEIFAGTNGDGLYKSTDGGGIWTKITSYTYSNVTSMTKDQSGSLIVGTSTGELVKTTDEGISWKEIKNFDDYIWEIIVKGSNVYVAADDSGLFYSDNNGIDWSRLNDSLTTVALTLDNENNIFLGTNGKGLYKSTDLGATWNEINDIPIKSYSKLFKLNSNSILAAVYNGDIYRYDNETLQWGNVLNDTSTFHIILDFIEPDSNNLFAASNGSGIFTSKDSGLTWINSNDGLKDSNVISLTYDSLGFIYAGTASGVVYKSYKYGFPEQVNLVFPNDSVEIDSNQIQFSWLKSNYSITAYQLEISSDSLFSSTMVDSTIEDTSVTIYSIPDNYNLWWRVRAKNPAGWGAFSQARRFRTNIPPSKPTLFADAGLNNVKLFWRKNPETDIEKYYIYSGIDSTSLSLNDSTGNNDTSKIFNNLTTGETYFYRLAVQDSSGNLSQSSYLISETPNFFTPSPYFRSDSIQLGKSSWGDYNSDGLMDILQLFQTDDTTGRTSLYQNTGSSFEKDNTSILNMKPGETLWFDYNNDNRPDVLLTGSPYGNFPPLPDIVKIYSNNGNGNFSDVSAFNQVGGNVVAYADYDNDGDNDIMVGGWDGSTGRVQLFRNDGNNNFVPTNIVFPELQNPLIEWIDYDNDGDMDLFIAGQNFSTDPAITKLYRNDGPAPDSGWIFTDTNIPFIGLRDASATWGDYNNDGYLDLVIIGWNPNTKSGTTKMYKNNGDGSFTEINISLPPLVYGDVSWGDFDNDGKLDLAYIGSTATSNMAHIYKLNSTGNFELINAGLNQGITNIDLGDYDNDNDLDLICFGNKYIGFPFTVLYHNNYENKNTPPLSPSGLEAKVQGNSVWLKWYRATDAETPSKGLSYNLSVGTQSGKTDIVSPLSNFSTGFHKIPRMGNVDQDTAWLVRNLKPGKYYWTIQSIDNSFIGSKFAPVDSFAIATTGIDNALTTKPSKFILFQNYPNPFNPATIIKYEVPKEGLVTLKIYDVLGREIKTLVNEVRKPGSYKISFDGSELASGIYFYRITSNSFTATKKMLLMK